MMLTPTRILAALNALALAGVAGLWVDPQGRIRNSQWTAPAAIQPELGTALKVENAQFSSDPAFYTASLERPLFSPDRRGAPVAAADKPTATSDTLSEARIFGLISGDTPIVLMRSDGKTRSVRLNESLGDWSLTAVGDREATFTRGPETRVLRLEYAALATTASPGAGVSIAVPALKGLTQQQTGLLLQQAESMRRQDLEQADTEARVAAMRAKMAQDAAKSANPKKP